MINKDKIKAKIVKAINKLPSYATIVRYDRNEFDEPSNTSKEICSIVGLYHESGTGLTISLENKGEIKRGKYKYFMTVYSDDTSKIKKDDVLTLDGIKYIIKDLGNVNKMGIYLDLMLQEMD